MKLNTKTIENKHFIHHLKRFPQILSTTEHINVRFECQQLNTIIRDFLIFFFLISKVSELAHLSEPLPQMRNCFQYKLSSF